MSLLTYPKFQVPALDGANLSGGLVYFYISGTATPKDTYSDDILTTTNTNPVILDARGEADIFLDGDYKIILKDADDVEVWTIANYTGVAGKETVKVYDNIAALQAITTAPSVTYVSIKGYTTDGDGGGGDFYWDSASTATDNGGTIIKATAITTGRWIRPTSSVTHSAQFGLIGDSTDETAQLTAFFALSGNLIMGDSLTYKTTANQILQDNTSLNLNGSTLLFAPAAASNRDFDMGNKCEVYNGTVENDGPSAGASSEQQTPIIIGNYGTGIGKEGVHLHHLTIVSDNTGNGTGIMVLGDSNNIDIHDIDFPASSTIGSCIICHWGHNDDPGAYTTHPNNIRIKNITVGALTLGVSDINNGIIGLSACSNVTVENIYNDTAATILSITAGDRGGATAQNIAPELVGRGIRAKNIHQTSAYRSVYINGLPTVSGAAIIIDAELDGLFLEGLSNTANTNLYGVSIKETSGVTIRNSDISNFYTNGIYLEDNVKHLTIEGGAIHNNGTNAIANATANKDEDTRIIGTRIYMNGARNSSSILNAGLYVEGTRFKCLECEFGEAGTETQQAGIMMSVASVRPKVIGCHLTNSKTIASDGLMAFTSSAVQHIPTVNLTEHSNSKDITITAPLLSASIGAANPDGSTGAREVRYLAAAPTVGSWRQGDKIYDDTLSAGGFEGWVCTTSGTFSAATDATGDPDGSTSTVTGLTDTSDFFVGDFVTVSLGFPSAVTPYEILALTATTITLDTASNSVQTNVTIATPDPVFKTFGAITA